MQRTAAVRKNVKRDHRFRPGEMINGVHTYDGRFNYYWTTDHYHRRTVVITFQDYWPFVPFKKGLLAMLISPRTFHRMCTVFSITPMRKIAIHQEDIPGEWERACVRAIMNEYEDLVLKLKDDKKLHWNFVGDLYWILENHKMLAGSLRLKHPQMTLKEIHDTRWNRMQDKEEDLMKGYLP